MKIKMREQITGNRNGQYWPAPGQEIDLPEHEAAKLCAAGSAEPVVDDKPEKAVQPAPEKRGGKSVGSGSG